MYPHRIRLRGPWECEPLARAVKQPDGRIGMVTHGLPPPCRVTMPCRWGEGGLANFAGPARFRRRFGKPRQLDPQETLWLTFARAEDVTLVSLNGRLLERHDRASQSFEFDVSQLLQERNELVMEVEASADHGEPWGEVALEVRCGAFLRGVRAWHDISEGTVRCHVRGEAVGGSDRLLEIYVLLDRSTIAYHTIQPAVAGQLFDILSEEIGQDRWDEMTKSSSNHQIRVELVNGATVWYAVECPLE